MWKKELVESLWRVAKECQVCRRSRNGGKVGEWTTNNNERVEQDRKEVRHEDRYQEDQSDESLQKRE